MTVNKKVSLAGLESHSLKEGGDGPAAVLEKDGNYGIKFIRGEVKETSSGDRYLNLGFSVVDDDAAGSVIYANLFVDGEFESGASKGQPRAKVALDLCRSGGLDKTVDRFLSEKSLDLDVMLKDMEGKIFYARLVSQKGNDGVVRTQPIYYIKKEIHDRSRSTGINHRVAPAQAKAMKATPANKPSANIAADEELEASI